MGAEGFREVADPGLIFMDGTRQDIAGTAVSCLLEGTRSFLVEVQALVTKTVFFCHLERAKRGEIYNTLLFTRAYSF
jgi:predicted ATP-dependent serine protease